MLFCGTTCHFLVVFRFCVKLSLIAKPNKKVFPQFRFIFVQIKLISIWIREVLREDSEMVCTSWSLEVNIENVGKAIRCNVSRLRIIFSCHDTCSRYIWFESAPYLLPVESLVVRWGAGMVLWWERLHLINVTRVRFLHPVIRGLSSLLVLALLWWFFLGYFSFPPGTKTKRIKRTRMKTSKGWCGFSLNSAIYVLS